MTRFNFNVAFVTFSTMNVSPKTKEKVSFGSQRFRISSYGSFTGHWLGRGSKACDRSSSKLRRSEQSSHFQSSVQIELNFVIRRGRSSLGKCHHLSPRLVPTTTEQSKLTPLEREIIDFFVQLSALVGQPRSFAEIYGLLFISPEPLTMDDIVGRLELSKGSASQGLRFLREFGAIREIDKPEDRRTYYEAVAELRNLATRFLRDQISPQLDNGMARLERIEALVKRVPSGERMKLQARVSSLKSWGKRGRLFLPLITKIMGKG